MPYDFLAEGRMSRFRLYAAMQQLNWCAVDELLIVVVTAAVWRVLCVVLLLYFSVHIKSYIIDQICNSVCNIWPWITLKLGMGKVAVSNRSSKMNVMQLLHFSIA